MANIVLRLLCVIFFRILEAKMKFFKLSLFFMSLLVSFNVLAVMTHDMMDLRRGESYEYDLKMSSTDELRDIQLYLEDLINK